jgi:hypothetical protein
MSEPTERIIRDLKDEIHQLLEAKEDDYIIELAKYMHTELQTWIQPTSYVLCYITQCNILISPPQNACYCTSQSCRRTYCQEHKLKKCPHCGNNVH